MYLFEYSNQGAFLKISFSFFNNTFIFCLLLVPIVCIRQTRDVGHRIRDTGSKKIPFLVQQPQLQQLSCAPSCVMAALKQIHGACNLLEANLSQPCRCGNLAGRQPLDHGGRWQMVPQVWGSPQAGFRAQMWRRRGAASDGRGHCPVQPPAFPASHVHHGSQSPSHALEVIQPCIQLVNPSQLS